MTKNKLCLYLMLIIGCSLPAYSQNLVRTWSESNGEISCGVKSVDTTMNTIAEFPPVFRTVQCYNDNGFLHAIGPVLFTGKGIYEELWICLDQDLKIKLVFPKEIQSASAFSNGISLVSANCGFDYMCECGAIDTVGNYIFDPIYESCWRTCDHINALEYVGRIDATSAICKLYVKNLNNTARQASVSFIIPDSIFGLYASPDNYGNYRSEDYVKHWKERLADTKHENLINFIMGLHYAFNLDFNVSIKYFQSVRHAENNISKAAWFNMVNVKLLQSKILFEKEIDNPIH